MAKYIAVVSEAAGELCHALSASFDVIRLPAETALQDPVASHADMLLCAVEDRLFVPQRYYMSNRGIFEVLSRSCGIKLCPTSCELVAEYPRDIAFNVLLAGKTAISLKSHTAPEVTSYLSERGYTHISVKQGYAACSSLVAGGLVVSADRSVLNGCSRAGLDTLEITPGHISLPGYDYGFIGGCIGVVGDTVYFTGDIDRHPDGKKIREALESRGYNCVCLLNAHLCDVGGIKFFEVKA